MLPADTRRRPLSFIAIVSCAALVLAALMLLAIRAAGDGWLERASGAAGDDDADDTEHDDKDAARATIAGGGEHGVDALSTAFSGDATAESDRNDVRVVRGTIRSPHARRAAARFHALFCRRNESGDRCARAINGEGELRIACIGDSITFGDGAHDPKYNSRTRSGSSSYPAELERLLAAALTDASNETRRAVGDATARCALPARTAGLVRVANFGINGATAADHPRRYSFRAQREYGLALAWRPHIVVVMLGTNDGKSRQWRGADSYAASLLAIVNSFEGSPLVILMTPPPIAATRQTHEWRFRPKKHQAQVVPAMRALAKRESLPLVDLNWEVVARAQWRCPGAAQERDPSFRCLFVDGVHPGRALHRLTARTLLRGMCAISSELEA
jgi:acyl-CoA thioesterase-1